MSSTPPTDPTPALEAATLARLRQGRQQLETQIRRVIVGQDQTIEALIIALFTGSHSLMTGAPGLAKTLLIRTIAQIVDLQFKRIQFTPDLMPADITGTEIIDEDPAGGQRHLRFVPGPVFTHILLADEINRTPPKTQAALLEAMEEKQVTVGGQMRPLQQPFHVFATQNPIELEGTYPLPEAQLDRFMFDIHLDYLNEDLELEVATRTAAADNEKVDAIFSGQDLLDFGRLVRLVPIAEPVARYAVRLVQASRPNQKDAPQFIRDWVSWGAGTRGSQNLVLAAKARALLQGRLHVSCSDIQTLAPAVLRHRILTNFRAEADRIGPEQIIARLLETIPQPQPQLD